MNFLKDQCGRRLLEHLGPIWAPASGHKVPHSAQHIDSRQCHHLQTIFTLFPSYTTWGHL
jgi:hypothetical protein